MDNQKLNDFTGKADVMLHKMLTMNELLKRSGKLSSPDYKLSLTDFKSLIELGETLSLAMELMPAQKSQKEMVDQMVKGLRQVEDMDLEKMIQMVSLFSAMNQSE